MKYFTKLGSIFRNGKFFLFKNVVARFKTKGGMEGTVIVADYYMNIAGNNFVLGRVLTMTHCKGQVLGTYYSP